MNQLMDKFKDTIVLLEANTVLLIINISNKRVIKMEDVSCHEGKCWTAKKGVAVYFDELFDESNIVDQIEADLWKSTLYGD